MPTKTISVTTGDILIGTKRNSYLCPIARAIRRACKFKSISVGLGQISWISSGRVYDFDMPKKVYAFVLNFDLGLKVRPITFQLRWKK